LSKDFLSHVYVIVWPLLLSGEDFAPIYLKREAGGATFFLITKKYKSFYCWWVTSLNPGDTGKYKAKLTWTKKLVSNEDDSLSPRRGDGDEQDSTYGVQWTLPIHSLKKSFDEIRDSGLCAVLPDTHMKPFGLEAESEEIEWNVSFEIVPLKKTGSEGSFSKLDMDWKRLLETLRHYFPLIALVFMTLSILLLCGIYLKAPAPLEDMHKLDNPTLNGMESEDFEGYRGFYYNRNNRNPNNNPQNREYYAGERKQQKHSRGPQGVGSPDESNEYVGYRGFYHKNDEQQNSDQSQNSKPKSTDLKSVASKLVKQTLIFMGNHVLKFLGFQTKQKEAKLAAPQGSTKSTWFGKSFDGLDAIGIMLAKFFIFVFTVACIFAVLAILAVYRRWIYSNPLPTRRQRRERVPEDRTSVPEEINERTGSRSERSDSRARSDEATIQNRLYEMNIPQARARNVRNTD
jgi:hypothetical protein